MFSEEERASQTQHGSCLVNRLSSPFPELELLGRATTYEAHTMLVLGSPHPREPSTAVHQTSSYAVNSRSKDLYVQAVAFGGGAAVRETSR